VPAVSTGVRRYRRSGFHSDGTVEIAGIDLKPGDISRRSGDFGSVGITQDVDGKVVRCRKRVGVWAVLGAREDLARRDRRTDGLGRTLPIIRLIAKTETKNAGGANAAERPYLSDEPARLCSLGAMILWLAQLSVETRLRLMHQFPR